MAIYHLSVRIISRSTGRSAIAAAAYRSGTQLQDANRSWDYSKRRDIDLAEIHLPRGAPTWMANRAALWSSVEATEKRRDARLAREVVIALPREIEAPRRVAAARDLARFLVDLGMVVDLAVHHLDRGNPHAHLMCSTRSIAGMSWGPKERSWDRRECLVALRARWTQICGSYGVEVDERSYAAQGVPKLATVHVGVKSTKRVRRGQRSDEEETNLAVEMTRPYPEALWLTLLPTVAPAAPSAIDRYQRLMAMGHPVGDELRAWSAANAGVTIKRHVGTEQPEGAQRPGPK